jgi:hypothetical protein
MTNTLRWLDELPPGAPERELLVAGTNARPPPGAVDAEWQALCVALTATAGVSSAATGVVVANSAAKGASGVVVSKATVLGSWVVGAKWFVAGAALGCGVAGASAVVQHVGGSARSPAPARPATPVARPASPNLRSAKPAAALATVAEMPNTAAETSHPELGGPPRFSARPDVSVHVEPPVTSVPGAASAEFAAPLPSAMAPLAEQARELAEVKRLIDAGSASEALRRLGATRRTGAPFALSEERDALYVQALDEARRRADARLAAREFLVRYPRSPYLETMRRLLAE